MYWYQRYSPSVIKSIIYKQILEYTVFVVSTLIRKLNVKLLHYKSIFKNNLINSTNIKPIYKISVRLQFHNFDQLLKHTQSGLWDIIAGEGFIYTALDQMEAFKKTACYTIIQFGPPLIPSYPNKAAFWRFWTLFLCLVLLFSCGVPVKAIHGSIYTVQEPHE